MTKNELLKRLKRIKASELRVEPEPINVMRRGENYVEMELEESFDHEDFFDFEKDLVEAISSRELAASAPGSDAFLENSGNDVVVATDNDKKSGPGFMIMEEEEIEVPKVTVSPSLIILEEIEEEEVAKDLDKETNNDDISEDKKDYRHTVGFKFVQCEFIKGNGERCKRQAPKNNTICSIHQKFINKKSINKKKSD